MSLHRIGLTAKPHPQALATLAEAAAWLTGRGATVVIANADERAQVASQVDVMIAFGGDGTLLSAASAVVQSGVDIPVLGVHLGHLGFLTEVRRTELLDALAAVLDGRSSAAPIAGTQADREQFRREFSAFLDEVHNTCPTCGKAQYPLSPVPEPTHVGNRE